MERWFSSDLLWDISNCKVDWVGGFVSEESELGLVG